MMESTDTLFNTTEKLQELIERKKTLFFNNLDNPLDTRFCKRFLTLALIDKSDFNPKKQVKSSLRARKMVVGFSIVEWHKKQGFATLNSLVMKSTNTSSYRLEIELFTVPFKLIQNQQKMEQQMIILKAVGASHIEQLQGQRLPTWMYIQCPPPLTEFIVIAQKDHVDFSQKLENFGFYQSPLSSQEERYCEYVMKTSDLLTLWYSVLSIDKQKLLEEQGLFAYLEKSPLIDYSE